MIHIENRRWFDTARVAVLTLMLAGVGAIGNDRAFSAPAEHAAPVAKVALDPKTRLTDDQRLVRGELENGLKYIVLEHANPPGRAAMWIHVSTGSLNETDKQRGIAHYLEHMAFNGSENFPPGSAVNFFQSMGLTFGQHQNAFTSFDQTVYQLTMPDNKPETVEKGMTFLADAAGRMLLLPKEIDEERGIILEEKRARSGAEQRVRDYLFEHLAPGSIVGQRLPIGTEETIKSVQEQDFKDYYTKYYVPSNMTLIVVADSKPEQIVEQIKKSFSFGKRVPMPTDQDPSVVPTAKTFAIVATDPELTQGSASIMRLDKPRPPATTVETYRDDLVREIALSAFDRRMGAKINEGNTVYTSASAMSATVFNAFQWSGVSADCKSEDWKAMLTELGTDFQRARLHGFSQREIDDVKKEIMSQAEQFVEQERSIPASVYLRKINTSVGRGEPILSAQQEMDLKTAIVPEITSEEVSKAFADLIDTSAVIFFVQLPSSLNDVPSESELVELGNKALDVKPGKIEESQRPTQLMDKRPAPGKVNKETVHEGSGVCLADLSNGVSVRHRFMDIRKDQVTVVVNLAAGSILESEKDRGVAEAAALAWARPATSKLTSTNVRDLMTGKKVEVSGSASQDMLTLQLSASPSDLESGLQLAHLLLTDPKIESGAFEQWKKTMLQAIEERRTDPEGALSEMLFDSITPKGELRVRLLTAEQVERLTLDQAQHWLEKVIKTAPIEVAIVGDFQKDRALELAKTYLGSLPARPAMTRKTLDDQRGIVPIGGPIQASKQIPTKTPLALVYVGFFGPDPENLAEARIMDAAARIIRTRMTLRVREQEQLTYSADARYIGNPAYGNLSLFRSKTTTDPLKVDRVVEVCTEIFDDFAKNGPTAEEMETMKRQTANALDELMKQPAPFWTTILSMLEYRSRTLDDVMGVNEFFQKLTAEEVKAVFTKYHTPERQVRVIVKPEASQAIKDQTAEPPAGQ